MQAWTQGHPPSHLCLQSLPGRHLVCTFVHAFRQKLSTRGASGDALALLSASNVVSDWMAMRDPWPDTPLRPLSTSEPSCSAAELN